MAFTREEEQAALERCAQEPIRTPGCTQRGGVVIAADRVHGTFRFASANVADLLGLTPERLFALTWSDVFPSELCSEIRRMSEERGLRNQRDFVGTLSGREGQTHDVFMYVSADDRLLFEVAPRLDVSRTFDPLEKIREYTYMLENCETVHDALERSTGWFRRLLGHDRVMGYRFLPDGAGEVAAEDRAPDMEPPFLGLRYPRWDVPDQARDLYVRTPSRIIENVHASDVPLVPADPRAPSLDMALAVFRGTSEVHRQYLSNMGVGATASYPIVVGGRLWGLIACHHRTPRRPPQAVNGTCEVGSRLLSSMIAHLQRREVDRARIHIDRASKLVLSLVADTDAVSPEEVVDNLAKVVRSDGGFLRSENHTYTWGLRPEPDVLDALVASVKTGTRAYGLVGEIRPGLASQSIGGALVRALSTDAGTYRFGLVRRPIHQVLRWAGAPTKGIARGPDGTRLIPRASFAEYLETTADRCEAWIDSELHTFERLSDSVESGLTIVDRGRESSERMGLLVQELNHRVRNLLALVRSLIRQTRVRDGEGVRAFVTALESRILSLSTAHNLLTATGHRGVRLQTLVEKALQPFSDLSRPTRLRFDGPDVLLQSAAAPLMALVLHELATNAVKYGSLSVDEGQVDVRWSFERGGLEMTWHESGGPSVVRTAHRGLGTTILTQSFPYELDGEAQLDFRASGLAARFWLPSLAYRAQDAQETYAARSEPTDEATEPTPPGRDRWTRVLVVEDSYVLASDLRQMLMEFGADEVDLAKDVPSGLAAAESGRYAFAVLDINLRGAVSYPIADRLLAREIPFVFATGYDSMRDQIPARFASIPVLTKPISSAAAQTHLNLALDP